MIRRNAIRIRLTAWYAGSVLVLLAVAGFFCDRVLHRMLESEFDRSLTSAGVLVQNLYRWEIEEYRTPDSTVAHVAREILFPDRVVEFVRPDGGRFVTPARAPALGQPAPPVRVTELALDPATAPGWRIRIRSSAAGLARSLDRVDLFLLLTIPMAVAAAGLTGWWLAGRTLRPVGLMAAAAERITAAEPSGRLPILDPADELGRLGGRFNALLDRLDAALAQQRRFLADAAHELRTPLARLSTHLELALGTPAGTPGHARALELAQADARHTRTLLDELLQLARADAGERPPELEHGFVDDVVTSAVGAWRAVADRRRVRLVQPEVEEASARMDPVLVRRLLDVLLDNALRYTPAGGVVEVRIGPGADGGAALVVEDNGIGIPEADRRRLFERFFRGRDARALAPDGSGLGLPIAQWIVRQHGGRIVVEPGAGGGTRVRVGFPPAAGVAGSVRTVTHRAVRGA